MSYAVELGLPREAFERCLDERRFAGAVEADVARARELGVRSTPTFVINGRPLIGAQPLRVVMGERDLDPGRRIFSAEGESLHLRTRHPEAALKELFSRDRQHVFLEGGPTLAAAFLGAGLVDEIVGYVAPMLLGAGPNAVADLGITSIADALRPTVTDVAVLEGIDGEEPNVRLTMTPRRGS